MISPMFHSSKNFRRKEKERREKERREKREREKLLHHRHSCRPSLSPRSGAHSPAWFPRSTHHGNVAHLELHLSSQVYLFLDIPVVRIPPFSLTDAFSSLRCVCLEHRVSIFGLCSSSLLLICVDDAHTLASPPVVKKCFR